MTVISTDFINPNGTGTGPDTPAGGWAARPGPAAAAGGPDRDRRAAR